MILCFGNWVGLIWAILVSMAQSYVWAQQCGRLGSGSVEWLQLEECLCFPMVLCFSRPAGTCLHDNWAGFQERVDIDSGLLRPCPQNWHVVTYTTLYWPTESHSQPTFKKWKKKLHSLMQRNSKLHWKGVNIRKTERLWSDWKIYCTTLGNIFYWCNSSLHNEVNDNETYKQK